MAKIKSNKKHQYVKKSLFESIEEKLGKHINLWQIALTFLAILFSIFMFDAKVSIGHDDSLYILAGYKYAKDFFGYWYSDNAPFYVMFLALPISLFGLNLIILKLISVLCFSASVWLLFSAFKGRIPHLILVSSIFIYALNYFALSYASLTYTEAFFLLIQSIFFLLIFKHLDLISKQENSYKSIFQNAFKWIFMGFIIYLLYFTRTVGIGVIAAVAVYFMFKKEFKNTIAILVSFGIIYVAFEILKKILWGDKIKNLAQTNILFLKDAYDPSKGTEDFSGFIDRFFGNTVIYISSRFWEMLGFRKENAEFSTPLALFTVILLFIGLIYSFRKKQNTVFFTALYCAALLSITFVALQTSWGQGRLIMVYLPLLMIVIFYGLYKIFETKNGSTFQVFFILILTVFIWKNTSETMKRSSKNISIVKKNLIKGDKFEGYTDDYKNFLKLSEWCADSLPKGSYVASRKAPMSFVYGRGMEFFPIYKVSPIKDADSILAVLKKSKVTHVIFANLRLEPKTSGDIASVIPKNFPDIYAAYADADQKSIINTMQNYFSPVAQKYPEKFELVKQMGTDEEALLYKINY
ncbi:MAG: hypothetical protein HUU47_06640 [Bacteroidetes bacterium]|nr:hypothetical protein [Bacteroidota bacterium]